MAWPQVNVWVKARVGLWLELELGAGLGYD
jgi:hypothetical protein